MPKFFDIHSHINFNAFKDDGDEVIKRTLDAGVWTILVGSQYDTSKRAVEYANRYEKGIYAAVGLHPFHLLEQDIDMNEEGSINDLTFLHDREKVLKDKNFNGANEQKINPHTNNDIASGTRNRKNNNGIIGVGVKSRVEKYDFEKYLALAKSSEKVVAIGECGLDYQKQETSNKKQKTEFKIIKKMQIETFKRQIELSLKINKPLIIHCRNVYKDILDILSSYRDSKNLRGNIHCFLGNWDEAKKYFDLGFSVSFTGIITFTNAHNEVIKKSPLERIMIETDSPYLAPIPYRGKRNEPLYVKEVARRIAEIKNLDFEKVAEATTKNALKMFGISI